MAKVRETQANDIRQLMMETAKVQVASLDAGIAFWTGWVERTSAFAKTANAELLSLTKESADTDKSIARLVDSSREYLRQVTELPSLAAAEFSSRLNKSGSAGRSPRRSGRAKP
jgi:hypothetical protein